LEPEKKLFCLEVKGDYACFTRPEMKVERVSYDVITPSAARAVFEAIFWKPAIRWHIKRIEVLNPIKWVSVRRNEVGSTMSDRSDGIFIEDKRQQRAGLFLKDVCYRLYAYLEYLPPDNRSKNYKLQPEELTEESEKELLRRDETPGKYLAMFERRAKKGQCFNQPYLGCREFSCDFRLVEDLANEPVPIPQDQDLNIMLYDMDIKLDEKGVIENSSPIFYRPQMKNGIIEVPHIKSAEVYR